MASDSHHTAALDTLRLTRTQQRALHQQMLQRRRRQPTSEHRIEPRQSYIVPQGLVVEVYHPGGTHVTYLVRPRDLSSHGIGFLHGAFMHQDTECCIWMQTIGGTPMAVDGHVARCQWLSGRVHEVGVAFEESVQLEDFITPKVLSADMQALSEPLPSVNGRVMYLCDSEQAPQTIAPLGAMGLVTHVVESPDAAKAQLTKRPPDMVLVDMEEGFESNRQAITALREAGFDGPVVVMHDGDEAGQPTLREVGCTAVITPPLTYEHLIAALNAPCPAPEPPTEEPSPSEQAPESPDNEAAPAPAARPEPHRVMQALLHRMFDHVKRMWERFTELLN